jgi:hypothetical protein
LLIALAHENVPMNDMLFHYPPSTPGTKPVAKNPGKPRSKKRMHKSNEDSYSENYFAWSYKDIEEEEQELIVPVVKGIFLFHVVLGFSQGNRACGNPNMFGF